MALTQLLGGPDWDVTINPDYALYADWHYFFNSGSVIRTNPWNSPQGPVAKIINVTNITGNDVPLNYINTSGSLVSVTLSGSESRTITSQTIPLGLDNTAWLSASFISNYTGSIIARTTGSRWFELDAIRTIAQSTYLYTIPSGSTSITRASLSNPVSGSSKNYVCSQTLPYVDQPFWLIRDLYDCSGGSTTTTTTLAPTTTTTSTTTTLSPNFIEYLVVAGGGGGGWSNNNTNQAAAGGGAGGFMTSSATLSYSGTPITVTVGTGGTGAGVSTNSTNGGNSAFNDLVATGGGRGGKLGTSAEGNGGNGGSGGGALYSYTPGTGISGEGFAGNAGSNSSPYYGGSGGGALNAAGTGAPRNAGGSKQWLDGNYYAAGGLGYNANSYGNPQNVSGSGGNGSYNANGTNGNNGIVIIRYQGIPRATGGTLTYTGGYTYHTFTSSGDFTFSGVTTTTTSTTTASPTTTTLASQKYLLTSCIGDGDIIGVFTILNAPLLAPGDGIRIAGGGIAGYYCFYVNNTSTGTSLGDYSITNIYPGTICDECTE